MPYDANGNALKVGDPVVITGRIATFAPSENYSNVKIELDLPQPPDQAKTSVFINTRQLMLAGKEFNPAHAPHAAVPESKPPKPPEPEDEPEETEEKPAEKPVEPQPSEPAKEKALVEH